MKKAHTAGAFLCGMLTTALLLTGTAGVLAAAGGSVSFGALNLGINGDVVLEKGATLTAGEAATPIPSSILYNDETGGGTTYVPLAFFSQMLDIPVTWDGETGTVWLGNPPSEDSTQIEFGTPEEDPIWETQSLHQAGAQAGLYTELEPYWPTQEEIKSAHAREEYFVSPSVVSDTYYPPNGRYFALSITNQSDVPLILSMAAESTITKDWLPDTVVPAGETVVRTFQMAEYTGALEPPALSFRLVYDRTLSGLHNEIRATVSAVDFLPA